MALEFSGDASGDEFAEPERVIIGDTRLKSRRGL